MTVRDSNGIVLADGKYSIKHVLDHYEHLVRYAGWYSNAAAIVQKLWNYCNGPGLGQGLARSPARKRAGASVKPGLPCATTGCCGDYPRLRGDRLEQLTLRGAKSARERS